MYDFTTNKQVTLPKHWEDFEFSPQDDKIVAKSVGNNADNRFLVVSNPDGSNARTIEDLGDNEERVHSSWSPNNQVVAYSFTGEPLGMDRQQVLLLGQNRENFKGLVIEGRGFIPKWSPSGNNLLYSVYTSANSYRPTLWISGAAGDSINENRRNLQISTWADKCAWLNESSLVCGVPRNMPAGAGLQRGVAAGIVDDIYRLNLETGEVINLGEAQGASVQEISVTPDGSAAVFTDANSGRLIRFGL
jgi:Tol biopolymer transport system component